ncbi:unnamed protein product [Lampetra fluviatilis]
MDGRDSTDESRTPFLRCRNPETAPGELFRSVPLNPHATAVYNKHSGAKQQRRRGVHLASRYEAALRASPPVGGHGLLTEARGPPSTILTRLPIDEAASVQDARSPSPPSHLPGGARDSRKRQRQQRQRRRFNSGDPSRP